jgi:hypothetical protein
MLLRSRKDGKRARHRNGRDRKFAGHYLQNGFSYGGRAVASVRQKLFSRRVLLSFPYNMIMRAAGGTAVAGKRQLNRANGGITANTRPGAHFCRGQNAWFSVK